MIYLCYKREKYQEYIIDNVDMQDNVVELGCHVGITTKIISRLCEDGTVFAFDNSPESKNSMSNLGVDYKNVKFFNKDVRQPKVLDDFVKICDNIDVLCIDLGGGYHPDTVFKVFFIWSSILEPKVTIIRNRGLVDFFNSSKTDEKFISKEGFLKTSYKNIKSESLNELKLYSDKLD